MLRVMNTTIHLAYFWDLFDYVPVPKAGIEIELQLALTASFKIESILALHIVEMPKKLLLKMQFHKA